MKIASFTVFLLGCISFHVSGQVTATWLEPEQQGVALQYEKIEWGIVLPIEIQEAIDQWISNQKDEAPTFPALNPFDPDQIDVSAHITPVNLMDEKSVTETACGFFYQDYQREMTDDDVNHWDWKEQINDFPFRVRWAAEDVGKYKASFHVKAKGFPEYHSAETELEVAGNDASNGFISVSENGHFFITPGSDVFFPIGKNIWEGAFDCGCNIPCVGLDKLPSASDFPCSSCYPHGENDPCCGLSLVNRMNRCKPWDPSKSVREMCLPLVSYLKLHDVIDEMYTNGANAIRFPIYQSSFEIEFEKLNNYLDRQYQAWELDQLIEHCSDRGIRIQLNMGIQTPYQNHPYGNVNWDWYDTNICDERGKSQSWCYRKDLNLERPIDFFTSVAARVNYKKKLRYFIARWGYSKDIYLLELLSEMNGVGSGTEYNHPAEGCDYWNKPKHLPQQYDLDMKYREALSAWNIEMSKYIKDSLHHYHHLLSVNYTGKGPMNSYLDSPENPCMSGSFDQSWDSPYLDVICWNNYGAGATRFRGFAEDEYGRKNGPNGYHCVEGNNQQRTSSLGYQSTKKPVVYGENGFGDAIMACDYTGFVKELVALPFTGHANGGMSWDEISDSQYWYWMGRVRSFLDEEFLPVSDLGKEEWIPGYANSASGGTSKSEVVYLRHTKKNRKELVGVIMNRSWNWYTVGVGGTCDVMPDESVIPTFMQELSPVNPKDEPLKILSMEVMKKYNIQYFDPMTLGVIRNESSGTFNGKLELLNYPVLTEERPFVFFKASRSKVKDPLDRFMKPN